MLWEVQYRTRPQGLRNARSLLRVFSFAYQCGHLLLDLSWYAAHRRKIIPTIPRTRPNNLSISAASKEFFHGFRLSTIFRGLSGSPYSTTAGFDLDG